MFTQSAVLTDASPFADFITITLNDSEVVSEQFLPLLKQIPNLVNTVNQADSSCNIEWLVAFSDSAWSKLFTAEKPAALMPFAEMKEANRHFPATTGDVFIFIKSSRMDLNFRIAKGLADLFASCATVSEDIQCYEYLKDRDMIDFVDGTENPTDQDRAKAVLVGEEDPAYQGGSYITLQRYIHDLNKWNDLKVSQQEQVIGRTKAANIELTGAEKPAYAHVNKGKATDASGKEIPMYRQNMPYGNAIEHGSMFIGFANTPEVVNIALRKMIYADPEGHYDRLLDYTRAVTGGIFFAPPASFLNSL